jgi:hypothetical protein
MLRIIMCGSGVERAERDINRGVIGELHAHVVTNPSKPFGPHAFRLGVSK